MRAPGWRDWLVNVNSLMLNTKIKFTDSQDSSNSLIHVFMSLALCTDVGSRWTGAVSKDGSMKLSNMSQYAEVLTTEPNWKTTPQYNPPPPPNFILATVQSDKYRLNNCIAREMWFITPATRLHSSKVHGWYTSLTLCIVLGDVRLGCRCSAMETIPWSSLGPVP